jgi:hypothetical protein
MAEEQEVAGLVALFSLPKRGGIKIRCMHNIDRLQRFGRTEWVSKSKCCMQVICSFWTCYTRLSVSACIGFDRVGRKLHIPPGSSHFVAQITTWTDFLHFPPGLHLIRCNPV